MNIIKAIVMIMSIVVIFFNAFFSEEFCGNLIGGVKFVLKDKKVNNKY